MAFEIRTISGLKVVHAPAAGAKLLFVHGASAGAWTWQNFLDQFSAADYDCYAMDLRGHGANPPIEALGDVSLNDYANDVRAVMAELGEGLILIGHSMGAAIAQVVAQDAPLKALVLASAAPVAGVKFKNPPFNLWFLLHLLRSLPAMVGRKPLKPGWRVMRSAVLNKIPKREQRAIFERFGPESGLAGMEVVRGSIEADLQRVSFPILVISGSEDKTSLIEMEREIAEQHRADLIELPGHGHMFMLEPDWEDCGRQIIDWLEGKGVRATA